MVVQVFVEGSFLGAQRIPWAEQSLCLYCKYLKNFYLPGIWWLCQFPEIMKNSYSLRFDMLPPVKWSAFFSDSYEVEWIVGKAVITKKELSWVLSQKVMEGYMTEEDALATARRVLYESPKRLYRLD